MCVLLSFHQDAVTLLATSTRAEILPYEQPTPTLPPGEVAVLVPRYEITTKHQDGLGNEWFANAHTEDGAIHLYEAVDSQDQSAQPFPVYSYVPTMVCQGEACMCAQPARSVSGQHACLPAFACAILHWSMLEESFCPVGCQERGRYSHCPHGDPARSHLCRYGSHCKPA